MALLHLVISAELSQHLQHPHSLFSMYQIFRVYKY